MTSFEKGDHFNSSSLTESVINVCVFRGITVKAKGIIIVKLC